MKTKPSGLAILLLASMPGVSLATDKVMHLPFNDVVVAATESGKLDGSVKFYLADTRPAGKVVVVSSITLNQNTSGFGKSDQVSCDSALQSALIGLQGDARKAGANAVVDIVSDFGNEYRDKQNYECHIGFVLSGVALKAKLAKVQP